jgi:hypothetical protein
MFPTPDVFRPLHIPNIIQPRFAMQQKTFGRSAHDSSFLMAFAANKSRALTRLERNQAGKDQ